MRHTEILHRLVAAMLVIAAVVGINALTTTHVPAQNQNSLARSLKSIQTDKATLFYADREMDRAWFVEMVLPGTGESKAATENLKSIAAAL